MKGIVYYSICILYIVTHRTGSTVDEYLCTDFKSYSKSALVVPALWLAGYWLLFLHQSGCDGYKTPLLNVTSRMTERKLKCCWKNIVRFIKYAWDQRLQKFGRAVNGWIILLFRFLYWSGWFRSHIKSNCFYSRPLM